MKTAKNSSSTRRSLRNTTNVTKSDNSKIVKTSADPTKPAAKIKAKVGKGHQKKALLKTPVSKRKRETEDKAEESADRDSGSPESDEATIPASNTGQEDPVTKPKVKRPRKKKENQPTEELSWRALDDFDDDKASVESKKKASVTKTGDRRKQSLIERDIPCSVMVQNKPRLTTAHEEDDSDCEVLDGAKSLRNSGPFQMDIDDVQSEEGSNFCEIIEEGSSVLDYKKLYALARRVSLPSSIWACHVDPLNHFVSFTRFNPDFSDSGSNLVDRAVVFKGSMKPFVFCNGEITLLPEEINTFETLTDVAHALQHLNAVVLP